MFISFNNFIFQEEKRERDFQIVIVNLEHISVVWSHCLTQFCNQDGLIISIDVTLITNIKKTYPFAVLKLNFFKKMKQIGWIINQSILCMSFVFQHNIGQTLQSRVATQNNKFLKIQYIGHFVSFKKDLILQIVNQNHYCYPINNLEKLFYNIKHIISF